jgi:antitoxin ParD1/3/4/toxin ParE1/3/4
MTGYVLSVDADLDLDEIWEYIADDDVDAADRWIGRLFDAFEALARTPGMGHKREDLTDYPVVFWPVGSYLIIYRAEHRPIEIVAVAQGSRDTQPSCGPVCTETCSGHSLAIMRAGAAAGKITVRASASGLKAGEATVTVESYSNWNRR